MTDSSHKDEHTTNYGDYGDVWYPEIAAWDPTDSSIGVTVERLSNVEVGDSYRADEIPVYVYGDE
jgi:hypothetical protein